MGWLTRTKCRCTPRWPSLVTEQNGYEMPAEPAVNGSPWVLMNDLRARCGTCGAAYPGKFIISPDTPPPWAAFREPVNTVCSCTPCWPGLMAMIDGQWWRGRLGADGERVVDGAAEEAACRGCGARHLGPVVLESHL